MTIRGLFSVCFLLIASNLSLTANVESKPKLTLDEFFNYVSYDDVVLSPDGHAAVIVVDRPDWAQERFRQELWLYRDDGRGFVQLTQSGKDSAPQWSPDGRWIAFLSGRIGGHGEAETLSDDPKNDEINQLYLISTTAGEAIPVTEGDEEVHAFAWSSDSQTLYFATRKPWNKSQKEEHKKEWKDVQRYRGDERGDAIFSIAISAAIKRRAEMGSKLDEDADNDSGVTPGAQNLAASPLRIKELETSPDGHRLAFVSESVSERQEKVEEFEIHVLDLTGASSPRAPKQITHNEAVEQDIHWARDGKHIFFQIEVGSVEGKYEDTQPRLYWVDADTGQTQRWASDFPGAVTHYAVLPDGSVAVAGRVGTQVQIFRQTTPSTPFSPQNGWTGTYDLIASSRNSARIAVIHSTIEKPAEVYIADSVNKLSEAGQVTSLNKLFTERDLPKAKTYRWTAEDGTSVEGMLMYPPGKYEAKNLPMFVLIHGGPADADGDHFEADWYQWDRLAASHGWLVFEPNYRGSTGYGDKFLMGIVPEIVSRPGKDILEGVDALTKDGTADPAHLAIGGYSYGSYMTNWLITQSTQWKAAVTGAGSVEHIADWGNDDTTFDDAYFLGGLPWEQPKRYHDEAAIFLMNKVRTPTLIVGGSDDIRVAVAEDYLLDHALHNLGIPSELLIFPGEGHSLDKNPWHGKIKVREELKWLQKYGGVPAMPDADKR